MFAHRFSFDLTHSLQTRSDPDRAGREEIEDPEMTKQFVRCTRDAVQNAVPTRSTRAPIFARINRYAAASRVVTSGIHRQLFARIPFDEGSVCRDHRAVRGSHLVTTEFPSAARVAE